MEIVLAVISLALVVTSVCLYQSNKKLFKLQSVNSVYDERVKNLLSQLQEQGEKYDSMIEENNQLGSFKGRYEHAQSEIIFLREEKERLSQSNDMLRREILEFEKSSELLKQSQRDMQNQKEEWDKNKETMLFQLSEELIKKNNEQQTQLSTNQQENIKKITEDLFKNFENVTAKVTALNDDVKKSADESALIKNALLNPGSAGRVAEITLENILKSSGLREKENLDDVGDYVLQSHFGSAANGAGVESKRPDAILFFPNDQIAVIDSKSSPHFLDLEQARKSGDTEQEKILLGKIKDSFRRHLDGLCRKEYTKFLFEELCSKNRSDYKILVVMFLQTESMLETINKVDPGFEQRALEKGVILATPIGLINFLSQARFVIDRIKQDKNIENLKIEVRKLLDGVSLIFKESKEVGKSLNKASVSYEKLVKNLNRGVYRAVKNISELGIEGKKSADLKLLEEYDTHNEDDV